MVLYDIVVAIAMLVPFSDLMSTMEHYGMEEHDLY